MRPATLRSLLTYDFSFRNLCLMAIGDLRLPRVLRAFEPSAGGSSQQNQDPVGESDAGAMLAALADISTANSSSPAELTIAYLAMAQQALGVRGAFITQFGEGTISIGASSGTGRKLPSGQVFPLEASFCQYVQANNSALVIADALSDPRVSDIAMRRELDIRAYLGVPIHSSDGSLYGTVCAVDPLPRTFSQTQIDLLRIIA